MEKESRTSILSSISDWLKLLALAILVAEAIIMYAMYITPKDHALYSCYPIIMILFLAAIVIFIFVDRQHQRDSSATNLRLKLDSKELSVDTNKTKEKTEQEDPGFIDSRYKFSFANSKSKEWKSPQYLSWKDYLLKMKLIKEDEWENIAQNLSLAPFGKMISNSHTILFQFGEEFEIGFEPTSTTDSIEKYIEKVPELYFKSEGKEITSTEIEELRHQLFYGSLKLDSIVSQNSFVIQVLDKKNALSIVEPNLPNLFTAIQRDAKEPLDQLVSNKDSILWGSTNKIKNISINGKTQDITIYRMNRLLENDSFFYQLQIQWAPQLNASMNIWDELKNMFETFKLA